MANKKLHPTIQQFKNFVQKNPKIIKEVRKGSFTWQELYEEWYILGEDDSRWDEFKDGSSQKTASSSSEGKTEWFPQIMGAIKNMDPNELQGHISSLSSAIGAIQGVLAQFQTGDQPSTNQNTQRNQPSHPFQFRKD